MAKRPVGPRLRLKHNSSVHAKATILPLSQCSVNVETALQPRTFPAHPGVSLPFGTAINQRQINQWLLNLWLPIR